MDSFIKLAIGQNPVVKQINQGFNSICEKFEGKDELEKKPADKDKVSIVLDEDVRIAQEKQKKAKEKAAFERTIKRAEVRTGIREKYNMQPNQKDKDLLEHDPDQNGPFSFYDNTNPELTTLPVIKNTVQKNVPRKNSNFKQKVMNLFKINGI
ncbi:unnamed protein product [Gordionus sp. m RMFG-2023]